MLKIHQHQVIQQKVQGGEEEEQEREGEDQQEFPQHQVIQQKVQGGEEEEHEREGADQQEEDHMAGCTICCLDLINLNKLM